MKSDPAISPEPVEFLVCFAVKEEAAYAVPLPAVPGGRETLVTGMGRRNASVRFQEALTLFAPQRVITCGFAGALHPRATLGQVLFEEDFDAGLGETLRSLGAVPGKFYCSARVAITAAEKAQLWHETGADAVEMESSVIRTLCRARGIPSATVRVISDDANHDLPLDFNALMTSSQKISILRLAGALVKSPGALPRLLELQRHTRLAARNLAVVLRGLLTHARAGGGG